MMIRYVFRNRFFSHLYLLFSITACLAAKSLEKPKSKSLALLDEVIGELSPYHMVTADYKDGKILFKSDKDYKEAVSVGFFRIPIPKKIDAELLTKFAENIHPYAKEHKIGKLNVAEGFLESENNQTDRLTFERSNWAPYYPKNICEMGERLTKIATDVLLSIFEKIGIPKKDYAKASSGCSKNQGSPYLLFNCYNRDKSHCPFGVVPHADWSFVTLLLAWQAGLQAKIDGVYRPLVLEKGYLTINFGTPLERLTQYTKNPVKASWHRVKRQKKSDRLRTSTACFLDPNLLGNVHIYKKGKLISSMPTLDFFAQESNKIYKGQ